MAWWRRLTLEWFGVWALNGWYYGMRNSVAMTWEEIDVQDTGTWDVKSMCP
jgi:hypothetical protein